jgi:hypothetical protein
MPGDTRHDDRAGEELCPWQQPGAVRRDAEPHRGKWLLWLGRAACACDGLSFLLWAPGFAGLALGLAVSVLAQRDLREMRAGRRDPGGRGDTERALSLAIIAVSFSLLGLILCGGPFAWWLVGRIYQDWRYYRMTGRW